MPLEQWIYFLNTGEIPDDATAPGLGEARQKLKLDHMTREELRAYYRHLDNVIILRDNITTARGEGHLEGKEEGRAEGVLSSLVSLVKDGLISVSEAAKRADMSEEGFKRYLD